MSDHSVIGFLGITINCGAGVRRYPLLVQIVFGLRIIGQIRVHWFLACFSALTFHHNVKQQIINLDALRRVN